MTVTTLGKITDTSGSATQVSADKTIRCRKITFRAVSASTGSVGIGVSAINLSTGAGVIGEVLKPTSGYTDEITLEAAGNELYLADYYVKPAVNGEGVYVTYWVQ